MIKYLKIVVACFVLLSGMQTATAGGRITMPNVGESVSGNTKVCFYRNGPDERQVTIRASQSCRSSLTFDTK